MLASTPSPPAEPRMTKFQEWRGRLSNRIELFDQALRHSYPLSSESRKAARHLLIPAAVGFVMESAHLVPVDMTVLGVKFQGIDGRRIGFTMSLIIAYLCVNYVIKASSDSVKWWSEVTRFTEEKVNEWVDKMIQEEDRPLELSLSENRRLQRGKEFHREIALNYRLVKSWMVLPLAAAVEISFPYLFGLYVIAVLARGD